MRLATEALLRAGCWPSRERPREVFTSPSSRVLWILRILALFNKHAVQIKQYKRPLWLCHGLQRGWGVAQEGSASRVVAAASVRSTRLPLTRLHRR
jgi:hypothetical protein